MPDAVKEMYKKRLPKIPSLRDAIRQAEIQRREAERKLFQVAKPETVSKISTTPEEQELVSFFCFLININLYSSVT